MMEGLFSHVHDATARTLSVNGYETREVSGPACCGALHAHAGLLDEARALARTNVNAFGDGEEPIVVNSAGCGALMKEYGHLLGDARGERFGRRVRDVTELLDLLQHQLGDEWISASPAAGAIRWTGDASVDRLQRLRRTLAGLEVPLTLERAPWALRGAVGHFGAYREGVGPLVAGLRRTFDPGGALVVATEGT
ncbi:MAG: hypothetical protein DMD66_05550 [Gemmatimonadetes bacterium]|nr:MAG: hypothetical protein DMD66_05550 [Gemmatimonadota bacterium]